MKRLLLMATLASVAFAGCSKDENFYEKEQAKEEISFVPVAYKSGSRATTIVSGIEYPTDLQFNVWAWNGEDASTGTNANAFMTKETVSFVEMGTNDAWAPSKPYFWPKTSNDKVDFFAISPANVSPAPSPADHDHFTITDYTVNKGKGQNVDLMYSNKACGKTSNDGKKANLRDGVALTFNHALAQLKFKIAKKDVTPTRTMTLTKVELTNVNTQAILDLSTAKLSTVAWSGHKTKGIFDKTGLNQTINTEPAAITIGGTAEDYWLVIPQTIDSGSYLTFTVTNNEVATEYKVQTNTIPSITEWEKGKIYTYTITLNPVSPDEILFIPSVTDWTNEAGTQTLPSES